MRKHTTVPIQKQDFDMSPGKLYICQVTNIMKLDKKSNCTKYEIKLEKTHSVTLVQINSALIITFATSLHTKTNDDDLPCSVEVCG